MEDTKSELVEAEQERYVNVYRKFYTENGEGRELIRIIPKDGMKLFEIMASYTRQAKPSIYRCVDESKKDALGRIKYILGEKAHIYDCKVIEADNPKYEEILTNRSMMPL